MPNYILQFALKAGFKKDENGIYGPDPSDEVDYYPLLKKFAVFVAAFEREECQKLCKSEAERAIWNFKNDLSENESFWNGAEQMASSCEKLIQDRNSHGP